MGIRMENLNLGIVLGFKLARLEWLWGSRYDLAQTEFEIAKNELCSLISFDNIKLNEDNYQVFVSSILDYYVNANKEIFYSILIGICIQRCFLIGASKNESANKELESLAKSALINIPNDIIRDKEDFFVFIKSKKTSNIDLDNIVQEVFNYFENTAQ